MQNHCVRIFTILYLSYLLLPLARPVLANAQVTSPALTQEQSDKIEGRLFAVFFRRAVLYDKMAAAADLAGTPKPHLRRNIATEFSLSDEDAVTVLRIAKQWSEETAPVQQRVTEVVKLFRTRFPNGHAPRGADLTPPAELGELDLQLTALNLRHRDLLHNSMRETDFGRLREQVRGGAKSGPNGFSNTTDATVAGGVR